MPVFAAAIRCARLMPELRYVTPAMALRMNENLVFDHSPAVQDFGFAPRSFRPEVGDLLPQRRGTRVSGY